MSNPENLVINNSNLGGFYRYFNNTLTYKSGVGPMRLDSGVLAIDDTTKATALNEYYCSVITLDDGSVPTFPTRVAHRHY